MDDERLAKIETERQNALNQSNNMYNNLLNDNQNLYNQQQEYANKYEQTQNDILNKQLAFNEEQINKQKEIAKQNMETESKKALNDYTSYNNPYGYQSESMASNGLINSGVSETSKIGSFNTYQNRLATANKVMQDAFVQYDKALNEARLSNNVQIAQNALEKLKMQLDFTQNYYNNKSSISQNQLSYNQNLDNDFYNRYQTEYNNIQNEKAREEAIRQWEANLAEQQRQYNETMAYNQAQLAEQQRQYNENLSYKKAQDALAQQNWEKEYALAQQSAKNYNSGSSNNGIVLTENDTKTYGTASNGRTIIANPYTSKVNKDAKYGVFDIGNGTGYQPNNINGSKLSKSGYIVGQLINGAVGSKGSDLSKQSIWTVNNKYYVWDGSINDYIDITSKVNYALKYSGPVKW